MYMFQYFPEETKKNHKEFKIFRLWAGIQTHHIWNTKHKCLDKVLFFKQAYKCPLFTK
jgi:hypothetical protein